MSEDKKPKNLLLEVAYSEMRATSREFFDGRHTWFDQYSVPGGTRPPPHLTALALTAYVQPKIAKLLGAVVCGITVELPRTSDNDTVISVYRLPAELNCHRLYVDGYLYELDDRLRKYLSYVNPLHVYSAEAARGELAGKKCAIEGEDFVSAMDTANRNIRGDKLHLFKSRGKGHPLPEFDGSTPIADVAVAELTPSLPDIQTRISALKGAFSLATGQYDDVTEEDIQAAVAAGYANPEVLVGVKDATWLMVEAHRDAAWHKGYDKGYEAGIESLQNETYFD